MKDELTLDEIAEAQAAVQINLAWWEKRGFKKSRWGRKRIKSLHALNVKLERIIDANCGHPYRDDEPDCGCGAKVLVIMDKDHPDLWPEKDDDRHKLGPLTAGRFMRTRDDTD